MLRLALSSFLLLGLFAAAASARTLQVGAGKEFQLPSEAVKAAHDGDHVAIYPGEYFDCAIVPQNGLVIEGVGNAEQIVITDKACQGKALLVLSGTNITVRNLTLTRARVPDQNGAGIRQEGRDLTIERVRFVNNQDGILSGVHGGTTIIRDSLFDRNGSCERACAHGIYMGQVDLLRVERTRFIGTRRAHHIKSLARRTEVIDCDIEDGPEGTASYEIDIPFGGDLLVRNTRIVKGPRAENHMYAISIAEDGQNQPTREIRIENSSFRNEGNWETVFLYNVTAAEAVISHVKFEGSVVPLRGDGRVEPAG
jgi:hypothetical protein